MDNYYWERSYSQTGSPLTRAVKMLLIANGVVFLFQILLRGQLIAIFGLIPASLFAGERLWQPFTYMFLHGGMWHILINMFILWMFGRDLEREFGEKFFLRYYFVTGVGAGLIYSVFFIRSEIPVIGASGAIFGLLIAFALIFPERPITLLIFFVLPLTLKAKHLVILLGIITLLALPTRDGIAHLAHLGGMVVGFLYLKARKMSYHQEFPWSRAFRVRHSQETIRRQGKKTDELNAEIDSILDKISREGMSSLTWRERRILQKSKRSQNDY
ncbi:MAG: Rhomboid protease GluP [Syntrophomonadaceae bacterium]|nr:Rhomboid protease GluP [Bacillota bacterium]